MKLDFASSCLSLAAFLWLAGTLVLCYCPLLYLSSTVLAALAVWKSAGSLRMWSWIVFIAAAVMTGVHFVGMIS